MEFLPSYGRQTIIQPDPNDYAVIDTFNRLGTLNASSATYAKFGSGLWADSDISQFAGDLAGFATRSGVFANSILGIQVFAGPKKVAVNVFGGTNSRSRIHIRKTIVNADRDAVDSIEITANDNGSGGIDSRIAIITAGSVNVIAPTADHGSGMNPSGFYNMLIEDTGTEIKLTIGGVTRSVVLPDPTVFENNAFVGINMRDSTEHHHHFRVW